ncbi:hypothetical protein B0H10DRAFT_1961004 [Mycena sp. CBHHK59/15]|nr:hypothetical protein B0H10DRAFT_1961004 [Mycena sp. CBHHK59/15]
MFNKLGSQSAAWAVKNKHNFDIQGMYTGNPRPRGTDLPHCASEFRVPQSFVRLRVSCASEFRQDPASLLFKCRICPITGSKSWMESTKRLKEHSGSKQHLQARKDKAKSQKPAHSSASTATTQSESSRKPQTNLALTCDAQEHVAGRIRDLVLDLKLLSYKIGFLSRLSRHILLNPGTYHIPQEFRAFITSDTFTAAVGKAATGRSELKRRMNAAWKKKTCIYELVKILAWKSTQEMTDEIWARFAWLQMKLVDYQSDRSTTGSKRDEYWDYIDKELADRRDLALEPLADRSALTSFVFEEALKSHLRHCLATSKNKRKSSTRLPKWQITISRAVTEMDAYSQEELAGEEEDTEEQEETDDTNLDNSGDTP